MRRIIAIMAVALLACLVTQAAGAASPTTLVLAVPAEQVAGPHAEPRHVEVILFDLSHLELQMGGGPKGFGMGVTMPLVSVKF